MIVNATDSAFGATPGLTDNRSAIQSAIDAVYASGGGGVYLPGTFGVAAQSGIGGLIGRSGVELFGEGPHTSGLVLLPGANGEAAHLYDATATENAGVRGLLMDGNRTAFQKGFVNGYHAVRAGKGCKRFFVKDTHVSNGIYYGIGIQNDATNPLPDEDILIDNVEVYDCGGWSSAGITQGDGIDIKYALRADLRNVRVRNCAQRGVDVRGRQVFMDAVKAEGNGLTGIAVRGNSGLPDKPFANPGHMELCNVYAASNGTDGIAVFLDQDVTSDIRCTISGAEIFSNGGYGLYSPNVVDKVLLVASSVISRGNAMSGVRVETNDAVISGAFLNNGGYGFDNGALSRRHVVTGIAQGNAIGQFRQGGADAKYFGIY